MLILPNYCDFLFYLTPYCVLSNCRHYSMPLGKKFSCPQINPENRRPLMTAAGSYHRPDQTWLQLARAGGCRLDMAAPWSYPVGVLLDSAGGGQIWSHSQSWPGDQIRRQARSGCGRPGPVGLLQAILSDSRRSDLAKDVCRPPVVSGRVGI